MNNGAIKFWWMSEDVNGKNVEEKICETVLDALWMHHCKSVHEVNNDNISFNVGSISYYNDEFLKPEYECEDGFVDFYTEYGMDASDLLSETYAHYDELGQNWIYTTKEQIKQYIIKAEYKPENSCIKMY